MMKRLGLLLLALLPACDSVELSTPRDSATFVVQVVGEQFRVRIHDEDEIAEARALLQSGDSLNLSGRILRGNGGFNTGYSWHLRPETVEFTDLTMELCDGRPSFVEANVDYFVDTVEVYCPWGVRVISEESNQ